MKFGARSIKEQKGIKKTLSVVHVVLLGEGAGILGKHIPSYNERSGTNLGQKALGAILPCLPG